MDKQTAVNETAEVVQQNDAEQVATFIGYDEEGFAVYTLPFSL